MWGRSQSSCWWSYAMNVCNPAPVCFPDVKNIWIWDFFPLCLCIQEVEKVLDSQWGLAVRQPPDTPKQILHERMDCHLVDTMSAYYIYTYVYIIHTRWLSVLSVLPSICLSIYIWLHLHLSIIKCFYVSIILTLVESSLVRYISLNFSAFFSGCLLRSVSISGST